MRITPSASCLTFARERRRHPHASDPSPGEDDIRKGVRDGGRRGHEGLSRRSGKLAWSPHIRTSALRVGTLEIQGNVRGIDVAHQQSPLSAIRGSYLVRGTLLSGFQDPYQYLLSFFKEHWANLDLPILMLAQVVDGGGIFDLLHIVVHSDSNSYFCSLLRRQISQKTLRFLRPLNPTNAKVNSSHCPPSGIERH
jgi:hypothetical protein